MADNIDQTSERLNRSEYIVFKPMATPNLKEALGQGKAGNLGPDFDGMLLGLDFIPSLLVIDRGPVKAEGKEEREHDRAANLISAMIARKASEVIKEHGRRGVLENYYAAGIDFGTLTLKLTENRLAIGLYSGGVDPARAMNVFAEAIYRVNGDLIALNSPYVLQEMQEG